MGSEGLDKLGNARFFLDVITKYKRAGVGKLQKKGVGLSSKMDGVYNLS